MAKKKAAGNYERYLITPDGGMYKIIGEDGIYWYCEGTQFFKYLGYEVQEMEIPKAEPQGEEEKK